MKSILTGLKKGYRSLCVSAPLPFPGLLVEGMLRDYPQPLTAFVNGFPDKTWQWNGIFFWESKGMFRPDSGHIRSLEGLRVPALIVYLAAISSIDQNL